MRSRRATTKATTMCRRTEKGDSYTPKMGTNTLLSGPVRNDSAFQGPLIQHAESGVFGR